MGRMGSKFFRSSNNCLHSTRKILKLVEDVGKTRRRLNLFPLRQVGVQWPNLDRKLPPNVMFRVLNRLVSATFSSPLEMCLRNETNLFYNRVL